MPELPEVETIRRSLAGVVSRQIDAVYLSPLAPVETTTPKVIRDRLKGGAVQEIDRHGKYLLLKTDRDVTLVIHFGMTGQLQFYDGPAAKREVHTHMELRFADGSLLRYRDTRRFGTLSLAGPDEEGNSFLARLGPDYLDPQLTDKEYVVRCRRHPRLSLKMATLNQGIAAGLGNIYACEALYHACLDPRRRIEEVSDPELGRLLTGARASLRLGIKYGGTTLRDYLDGRGTRGKMQDFLQVYGRDVTLDGKGKVVRIVQQARATWYCPAVQR